MNKRKAPTIPFIWSGPARPCRRGRARQKSALASALARPSRPARPVRPPYARAREAGLRALRACDVGCPTGPTYYFFLSKKVGPGRTSRTGSINHAGFCRPYVGADGQARSGHGKRRDFCEMKPLASRSHVKGVKAGEVTPPSGLFAGTGAQLAPPAMVVPGRGKDGGSAGALNGFSKLPKAADRVHRSNECAPGCGLVALLRSWLLQGIVKARSLFRVAV